VRIGINFGFGNVVYDEVTKGYDYYGNVANLASRVESCCHGGQIVASSLVMKAVGPGFAAANELQPADLGAHVLRGCDKEEPLTQLTPMAVTARTFPALKTEHGSVAPDDLGNFALPAGLVGSPSVGSPGKSPGVLYLSSSQEMLRDHDAKRQNTELESASLDPSGSHSTLNGSAQLAGSAKLAGSAQDVVDS
jgi:hypothetical protein